MTAVEKFLYYISSLKFTGRKELLKEARNDEWVDEGAWSKEELEEAKKSIIESIKALRRNYYNLEHYKFGLSLIDFNEENIDHINFYAFILYQDAIRELTEELEQHAAYSEKQAFIEAMVALLKEYDARYKVNLRNNLLYLEAQNEEQLSKELIPKNTGAIMELFKRYFGAFSTYVYSLNNLIHTSKESLATSQTLEFNKLIWIYKRKAGTDSYKGKNTESKALDDLYDYLLDKGYINGSTRTNFRKAFESSSRPFTKIIWLRSIAELHYLLDELISRQALLSIGDKWMAALSTFRQPNGLDFNYDSLKKVEFPKAAIKKDLDALLSQIFSLGKG